LSRDGLRSPVGDQDDVLDLLLVDLVDGSAGEPDAVPAVFEAELALDDFPVGLRDLHDLRGGRKGEDEGRGAARTDLDIDAS
jgi:hypothetical protein